MLSANSQSLRLVYFIILLNEMWRFDRFICTEMRLVIVCDRNQRGIEGQELKDTGLSLLSVCVFFFGDEEDNKKCFKIDCGGRCNSENTLKLIDFSTINGWIIGMWIISQCDC